MLQESSKEVQAIVSLLKPEVFFPFQLQAELPDFDFMLFPFLFLVHF